MEAELKANDNWSIPILLALMLMTLAWAVGTAGWVPGLVKLQWVALGAIVFGFLCAKSRIPALVGFIYSLVTGPVWIFLLFGSVSSNVLEWQEKLWQMVNRLAAWGHAVRTGGRGADNLVFLLQLAVIIWFVTYICVWIVLRYRKVWHAVLFAGTMLLLVLYNAPQDARIVLLIFLFLFTATLLVISMYLNRQISNWDRNYVRYDQDVSLDFLSRGALFATMLIAIAWLAPLPQSYPKATELFAYIQGPWEELQIQMSRIFSDVNYRGLASGVAYSDDLPLGGPVNLGDDVVMRVYAPEARYWRAKAYEEYSDGSWKTAGKQLNWPADTDLWQTEYLMRTEMPQTFEILLPQRRELFAASHPVRVNQKFKVATLYLPDNPDVPVTFSSLHSRRRIQPNDTYNVVSSVSTATPKALRTAGTAYPNWIYALYTDVPDSLPQRVRNLSDQITAPYGNTYDKVMALEVYLRQITYNDQIPAPPQGEDPVDYFLFESREGYCNYYASALALMARVQNIPARVVSGYTRGEFDAAKGYYVVRERNSHSWVEVYFPQYGWIEFEPTASETILRSEMAEEEDTEADAAAVTSPPRPEEEDDLGRNIPEDEEIPEDTGEQFPEVQPRPEWLWIAAIGGILLFGANIALWLWWWIELRQLSRIKQIFTQMCRYGQWIGIQYKRHQTPHEYAAALTAAMPIIQNEIYQITSLYLRDSFSIHKPTDQELEEIQVIWKELQRALQWQLLRKVARLS